MNEAVLLHPEINARSAVSHTVYTSQPETWPPQTLGKEEEHSQVVQTIVKDRAVWVLWQSWDRSAKLNHT